uniref:Uncharacterized protein n=1 Tax=Romanomermis culicivorax TaxID=13658 RepID=A0A915K1G9_ROMCU
MILRENWYLTIGLRMEFGAESCSVSMFFLIIFFFANEIRDCKKSHDRRDSAILEEEQESSFFLNGGIDISK